MNVNGKFMPNLIIGDCEKRIDEYRARVRSQQELIRSRRAEAVTLKQEADRCRAEADSIM